MTLSELETPSLILDQSRLAANIAAMSARMKRHGVDLRPHLKTAKSADVARLATAAHSGAITVSTLVEAAYFARHGFRDITYAVGVTLAKLPRVAALCRDGVRLAVVTDSVAVAREIAHSVTHALDYGAGIGVFIEIDSGLGRAGIRADDEALIGIARALEGAAEFRGVLTHAGQSYGCASVAEIEAVAEAERQAVVTAAERLRGAGIACPEVSVGSSPTARFGRGFAGVTETRPGVYMFNDAFQAGLGCCRLDDVALTVLTTVIGQRRDLGMLLIDAGGLALSKDRSTAGQAEDVGYGLVYDAAGERRLDGLRVADVHQEHGLIKAVADGASIPFDALPIGTRLRIMPNHACMTAAAYDRYHVVDGGDEIIAEWPRCGGW
jgi:D-serine deaminase-like pyridoxal phosphate-dependent protein